MPAQSLPDHDAGSAQAQVRLVVKGRVQGVGFRYYTQERALFLELTGWVRNLWDGSVEIVAEGTRSTLQRFVVVIHRGPASSYVSEVLEEWAEATGEFDDFRVRSDW